MEHPDHPSIDLDPFSQVGIRIMDGEDLDEAVKKVFLKDEEDD